MKATRLFKDFFHSEKSSGIVLIACTVFSLCLANFIIGEAYLHFWHRNADASIAGLRLNLSIEQWINDGLMTLFFLLVGMEIERELYAGELSSIKNAALPVIAAVGGMAVPALFHFAFNNGTATQSGFGIPMATDIAFALGILSLVGNKVPLALKVFLTALAIIDDLGAILIIAVFYTSELQLTYLFIALGIFGLLLVLNRLRVQRLGLYLIGGVLMWYCMLQSGVHATITGVLLAFAIPFGDGSEKTASSRLQRWLHIPVAFFIVPLFAFANTAIIFNDGLGQTLSDKNSLGILSGLVLGKPIGILLFCLLAVKLKLAKLPEAVNWPQLAAVGMLAGIGFTMSIFISLLAFTDQQIIQHSKIAVLISSLIAGIIGYIVVKRTNRNATNEAV